MDKNAETPATDGIQRSVNRVAQIVRQYAERQGIDPQRALRDLITDIRHYCDSTEIDFQEEVEGSYEVYCEEKQDARIEGQKQ